MMASHVQLASRSMARRDSATFHAQADAPILRGTTTIDIESSSTHLAQTDRALAWPRLAEHGTAHHRVTETTTPHDSPAPAQPTLRMTGEEPGGDVLPSEPGATAETSDSKTSDSKASDSRTSDSKASESRTSDSKAARSRIVERLYTSSYHRVFCFVRRYTNDEEAEEIAHEAFVRLLRVRNLERMSISVAYLLRIAENLLRRRHGRAQRYREILTEIFVDSGRVGPGHDEVDGRHCANARATDTRSLVDEIDSERLDAVLKLLTPSEQSAVRLIVCQGMDYDTAARSLGVPVSTINNWKHRALTKLKQFVEGSDRAGSGRRPTAEAC